ncbi:hypothetical protein [Phenylobacterium montanum]|uniref:Proteophosphoglycan 5 n=1 Tax=Phenylobacterium montanum TaxID=2823693 RepID=A0A975G441_9CAUL|nr:hypothetical protein [Caulobacter sp. S6]QUD90439.1 hypothetical protein KCG34_11525 [Caulobacter sp. S6]
MKLTTLTAAALLFAAPAAFAQTTTATSGAVNPPAVAQTPPAAEATSPTATPAPTASDVATQTVANAPIPDTQATRAKYPPLSHAGKATDPAGN